MLFGLMGLAPFRTLEQPALEVLHRAPARPAIGVPPLLFVHGAYAGAWCWDEHFLSDFAAAGYDAYAVSLRGHGESAGRDELHYYGVRDYVADLRHVIRHHLPREPIVIGHSMGGMVIQKYLETDRLPAAVLMASVPPTGLGPSVLRLMGMDPMLIAQIALVQSGARPLVDPEAAGRAVFSDHLDPALREHYGARMQSESQRALLEMTCLDLPRRWHMQIPPMLVLGAGRDALFSVTEAKRTARTYGATFTLFPEMAHAMMLEPDWRVVARRIQSWLQEQFPAQSARQHRA